MYRLFKDALVENGIKKRGSEIRMVNTSKFYMYVRFDVQTFVCNGFVFML